MVATTWATDVPSDFTVTTDANDQFAPSVADSGGGSFGVAWTSATGVTVRFYDVVGEVDPGLGTIQLTSSANATEVSLTAGGAVGYAAAWEESGTLMARYIGLASPIGAATTPKRAPSCSPPGISPAMSSAQFVTVMTSSASHRTLSTASWR